MCRMTKRNRRFKPDLELRVTIDGQIIIGPIQAMLLEAIRSTRLDLRGAPGAG